MRNITWARAIQLCAILFTPLPYAASQEKGIPLDTRAKEILKSEIYLVLGGFHLSSMDPSQIEKVVLGNEPPCSPAEPGFPQGSNKLHGINSKKKVTARSWAGMMIAGRMKNRHIWSFGEDVTVYLGRKDAKL